MPRDMQALETELKQKIRDLVLEYGAGKISNEQFDTIYMRYHAQLSMVQEAVEQIAAQELPGADKSTIAIKSSTRGKAVGMAIYHHKSERLIETLGNFDLSQELIAPVLERLAKMPQQKLRDPSIVKNIAGGLWVVFTPRKYTTSVVLFRHEPAPRQVHQLEDLLRDFEDANQPILERAEVAEKALAQPFTGFVQRRIKGQTNSVAKSGDEGS